MLDFNKRALKLGEDRVIALVEVGLLMSKAINKGATDNSCRTFLVRELGFSKEELTQATLLARFPLATYSGCTSIKEAKSAFEVAKEEAKTELARLKEEARKSEMTQSEIEAEQADIKATVAHTKANALDARPNKVAGLKVDKS